MNAYSIIHYSMSLYILVGATFLILDGAVAAGTTMIAVVMLLSIVRLLLRSEK